MKNDLREGGGNDETPISDAQASCDRDGFNRRNDVCRPPLHGKGGGSAVGPHAPWAVPIKAVDEALAKNDIQAVEFEWQRAYLAALGARRWEGMADVGDAALRIGDVTGYLKINQAKARRLFLAAFFLARERESIDGVLRATRAFLALGDREVATGCLRTAREIATRKGDAEVLGRVLGLEGELIGPPHVALTER